MLGDHPCLPAADRLKGVDYRPVLKHGGGAVEDELRRMVGIPNGVGLSDKAAEGIAEHDGPLDPEGFTECLHIVAPLSERPQRWVAMVAATVAAVVKHDELRDLGEWRECRLEHGMIEPWSTVQQQHSWPLTHSKAIRNKLLAYDVEEQAHTVDHYVHCLCSAGRFHR